MNNRKVTLGRKTPRSNDAIARNNRELARISKEVIPKSRKKERAEHQERIDKLNWVIERQLGLPSRRLY